MAMATRSSTDHSTPGATDLREGIEPVSLADAIYLAQAVDAPASESGPLFRTMFPRPGVGFPTQQKNEIIRWHAEGIEAAIMGGRTSLRKLRHSDGRVVGLAGWVAEERGSEDEGLAKAIKADRRDKSESWLPGALDVHAWSMVSGVLAKERQKVIGHLDQVCRR
jgi:hypothetical protein